LRPRPIRCLACCSADQAGAAAQRTSGRRTRTTNGQLDAAETCNLSYAGCRGAAGAAQLDGSMTLAVTAASGSDVTVRTATRGLTVTLPQHGADAGRGAAERPVERDASQGNVSYDANGVPTAGTWQITLPHNAIGVAVGAGTATVTLDHGPDGTIDRTRTFTTTTLDAEAA
jgi:hypothetical protein